MSDNPPAFPCTRAEQVSMTDGDLVGADVTYPGMTLRDWFAGQAVAWALGTAGSGLDWGNRNKDFPAEVARRSYATADAMLAERAKGQQP